MATASPCASRRLAGVIGGACAEQREHPAVAGVLARLLHQPAAQRHELEPVALGQAAGGDQRAELSERVAGHAVAVGRARAPPSPRRLAQKIAGCANRVPSSARANGSSPTISLDECEQVGAHPLHGVAHVRGLATLTWKHDRSYSHSAITLRGSTGPDTGA